MSQLHTPAAPRLRPEPTAEGDHTFVFPTSFAQRRLWFLDQLEPGSPLYNIPMAVRFAGGINLPAIRSALQAIVDRHEILRTTFAAVDGEPMQVVAPPTRVSLPETDLRGYANRDAELARRLGEQAQQSFDLANGPLLRAELLRLGADDYVLLLGMHHIISDGWSTAVLMRELADLYAAFARGLPSPLPPLALQYADFAVWQRDVQQDQGMRTQLAHWRQRLAGVPAVLELPSDRPRPAAQGHRGATHLFRFAPEVSRGIRALSARHGVTLFMTLLAGFYALLHRYTGQRDLVVGSPVANRRRTELEPLIGFFVNTLVLRAQCDGAGSFVDLLRHVRELTLDAFDNQDLPFDRLVEELQPDRALSHNPLFQVMFMLQSAPAGSAPAAGTAAGPVGSGTAKFDLILSMTDTEDALSGAIEYRTDMFDADRIARMGEHVEQLLRHAVDAPDTPVRDLTLLPAAEAQRLRETWTRTQVPYPATTIHEAFAGQAAQRPRDIAVEYEDDRLTYGALQIAAHRLARHLRTHGVGPGTIVGICLHRSTDMITAMLAVLSTGAAYVPLDAAYPPERLAYMVDDAQVTLVVAHESTRPQLPADRVRIVSLDGDARDAIAAERVDALPVTSRPDDLAYIIYTSGSTGRPKGSAITHRGILRLVHRGTIVRFAPSDRVAQLSNASFDPSVFEIWGALLNGARLVGLTMDATSSPQAIAAQLRDRRISVVFVTTAVFNYLARERPDTFAGVGHVIFGGEAADPGAIAAVFAAGRPRRLVNGYGPTECSVFSTYHEILAPPPVGEPVPIGRAVSNCRVYVLDQRLRCAPIGVPGEIHVGGDAVGDGYFRRPRLTAERFLPDPFSPVPGARLYRTGDVGRFRADGRLEYLGRTDTQVKIRGYRVELGEVEDTLRRHPAVRDAVVVARYDIPGGRLAAFVVERGEQDGQERQDGRDGPIADALRRFARAALPDHMVPATYARVDQIPLTPNGKVDRRALAARDEPRGATTQTALVAPRTPTERAIAEIWAQVLNLRQLGIDDDFFHLGGHSLLATQVMSRVRRALGVDLPLRRLFEKPTVAGLAALVDGESGERRPDEGPRPLPGPRDRLALSFAQERLWFLDQLMPGNTAYNVHSAFHFAPAARLPALRATMDELVRRHETLRTTFARIDGRPVQFVHAPAAAPLRVIDLSSQPRERRQSEAARLQAEEAEAPFDLEGGALFRALLLRLGPEDVLAVTMHHVISDGWSMGLFARELRMLYGAFAAGATSPLAELPIQYADFAQWQRAYLNDERLASLLGYWRTRLAGAPALQALPTDRPRPPLQSYQGSVLSTHVPRALVDRLQQISAAEGVTLFMTLLASFAGLLAHYSGQRDLVIGSPIANRTRPEIEGLIGFFVNTLVLRCDLSGDPTFRALLARVREQTLEAYAHQELPFEKLVEELQPERNLSHTPLFQVMFVLQNLPTMDRPTGPAGPAPPLPSASAPLISGPTRTKFDLTLAAIEDPWGLSLCFEYNADLFDTATIQRLAASFEVLLDAIGRDPDRHLSAWPLVPAGERTRLIDTENATARDYGPFRPLSAQIAAQAARMPEAIAVTDGEARLSYRDLITAADRVAQLLRQRGLGAEDIVGVCLERSRDLMIALVGVLRAGAAYLPLDPDYPADRLRFFLADARASVVLTSTALRDRLPASDAEFLCVDALDTAGPATALPTTVLPEIAIDPDQLAYVIYTSGSTGQPKGAMNTQAAIANRLHWMQEEMRLAPGECVVQKTPTSFDVSVWELFWPLCVGATVVLAPPGSHRDPAAMRDLVIASGASTIHFVPSMLRPFLDLPDIERCTSLARVVCSGEALTADLADRLLGRLSARLYNLYGPTEAAVDVTSAVVTTERRAGPAVAIGRPIANTQIHLLSERFEPVPIGVPGHLHIGGLNLGRGYLARPGLTADRFIPDPLARTPGARLYRTGDVAVRRPDGQIEFLGRIDQQVKLRGFRIELGEIEAALRDHPAVEDTVVELRAFGDDVRLVAYIVPHADRACAVRALARLERSGQAEGMSRHELRDGPEVFHLNRGETEFLEDEIFGPRGYGALNLALPADACVLDVGANIGLFSLSIAQQCERARIVAIEPVPALVDILRLNLALCPADVTICDVAASDRAGEAAFTYYPRLSILSGAYADPKRDRRVVEAYEAARDGGQDTAALRDVLADRLVADSLQCRTRRLSDIIRELQLARIDLVKIDVERGERDVLLGLDDADWPRIGRLLIEVHDVDGRLDWVRTLLAQHGFALRVDQAPSLRDAGMSLVYAWRPDDRMPAGATPDRLWSRRRMADALRAHVARRLPEHMCPTTFVMLDAVPLTPSGKVDRRALPRPEPAAPPAGSVAPRDPLELLLAEVWAEVLGLERVGIHDDFFALGGHSLLATQVISRIRSRMHVEIPLRVMFEAPTVARLRAMLDDLAVHAADDALRPIGHDVAADGLPAAPDVAHMSDDEVRAWLDRLLIDPEQEGA
jgi:amino acid adenylation domain-containing protein/FkbM family methyltransferase